MSADQYNFLLLTFGILLFVLEFVSDLIKERLPISEPLLAVAAGIIIGPALLDAVNIGTMESQMLLLEEVSILVIAITLIEVALMLPKGYILRHARQMGYLLGPGILLSVIISSLIFKLIFGGDWWLIFLMGAIVTPTDPVLASSVVSGRLAQKNIPEKLRNLISGESAMNDTLAYPLVYLALAFLMVGKTDPIEFWIGKILFEHVLLAGIIGAALGFLAGKLLNLTRRMAELERISFLVISLGLALLMLGSVALFKTDNLLSIFVAGIVYKRILDVEIDKNEMRTLNVIKRIAELFMFILFGIALPWDKWGTLGYAGPAAVAMILLFRRPPAIFTVYGKIPEYDSWRDALFGGWFGPIGISSIYYATFSFRHFKDSMVWTVVSLIVFGSVIVHGISGTPLTSLYGKRTGKQ